MIITSGWKTPASLSATDTHANKVLKLNKILSLFHVWSACNLKMQVIIVV